MTNRQSTVPAVRRNPVIRSMVLAGALAGCTGNAAEDQVGDADPVREQPIAYTGERMSANFQDVEVRSALQLIADFAGLNLVAGQAIEGRMSLRIVDVPWDEALDLVLSINGLGKRRSGSVLLVAPAAEIVEQERLELEHRKARMELAPLTRAFIRLRYADATALANLLAGDGAMLSERGRMLADPRTNSLVVTDTAANLADLRGVIEQLDGPVRQVQIEARIVNANANFSEELGIRLGGAVFTANALPSIRDEPAGDDGDGHPEGLVAHLGIAGDGASGVVVGIADARYLLDVQLSAMAADGRAEIVARPSVITADKRLATIESGVEIPFQQATKSGATSIAFKDAVLQLEVTPQITPNERIVMELTVKQDTVGRIYHGVPSVNTTRITTQVLVDNGQTVVLGGIFQTDRHQATVRTPLLGDLPVVGRLFRRTLERDDKQELFVFITPSIVQEPTGGQARMAPGQ
ncbi:MAG: type IV pilus secretin PilQ [Gammaproteobacteria bacterium]|nr:type IV pilus secretin PilQ [Gammaproteobacteria bacterium]